MGQKKQNRRRRRKRFDTCKYCYAAPQRHHRLCVDCASRTKADNKIRRDVLNAHETLAGFLTQKNISTGNIKTIKSLLEFDDAPLRDFASLVLEIAEIHPRQKRRIKWIKSSQPELFVRISGNENFDWYLDEYDQDLACNEDFEIHEDSDFDMAENEIPF